MNQNPEQIARDAIDDMLEKAGWTVQSKNQINLGAAQGIAIREYQTDIGPADYVLFVNGKPVGIIEAKREDEGYRITVAEEQSGGYAKAKLKYLDNDPLPYVYAYRFGLWERSSHPPGKQNYPGLQWREALYVSRMLSYP